MTDTGLQDGMLKYYLSVVGQSDANIEARLEREPFNVTDELKKTILNNLQENSYSKCKFPPSTNYDVTELMNSPFNNKCLVKGRAVPFPIEEELTPQEKGIINRAMRDSLKIKDETPRDDHFANGGCYLNNDQSRIDELEHLLNSEDDTPIHILPNGDIVEAPSDNDLALPSYLAGMRRQTP